VGWRLERGRGGEGQAHFPFPRLPILRPCWARGPGRAACRRSHLGDLGPAIVLDAIAREVREREDALDRAVLFEGAVEHALVGEGDDALPARVKVQHVPYINGPVCVLVFAFAVKRVVAERTLGPRSVLVGDPSVSV
jgi:hypothetical protein